MRLAVVAAAAFAAAIGTADAAPGFGSKSYRTTSSSEAAATKAKAETQPLAQRLMALLSIDLAPQFRVGDAASASETQAPAKDGACDDTADSDKAEGAATTAPARPRTRKASVEPLFLGF